VKSDGRNYPGEWKRTKLTSKSRRCSCTKIPAEERTAESQEPSKASNKEGTERPLVRESILLRGWTKKSLSLLGTLDAGRRGLVPRRTAKERRSQGVIADTECGALTVFLL